MKDIGILSSLDPVALDQACLDLVYQSEDEENLGICVKMAKKHKEISGEILKLVNESRVSGEPIVRHLAYEFPDEGFEKINDMFMFGSDLLVAPVIEKGAVSKTVRLPKGKWDFEGEILDGGREITVSAPINFLPVFKRIK